MYSTDNYCVICHAILLKPLHPVKASARVLVKLSKHLHCAHSALHMPNARELMGSARRNGRSRNQLQRLSPVFLNATLAVTAHGMRMWGQLMPAASQKKATSALA